MPKFFVAKEQIKNNSVYIIGEDVSHISRVLRMEKGDCLTVCDGCGTDYEVVIDSITKTDITASIKKQYRCEAEPNTEVIIFQCLPKQGKMEYIIQKCTELGMAKLVPVYSKRCVAKPTDKLSRWQKVALEAAKQSGRGAIPTIDETITFKEAINKMMALENCIMFYENEQNVRLKHIIDSKKINQIGILIGPEGGFEDFEAQLVAQNNIPTVTLGKRILRTETAAAAVLPIIMYSQSDI